MRAPALFVLRISLFVLLAFPSRSSSRLFLSTRSVLRNAGRGIRIHERDPRSKLRVRPVRKIFLIHSIIVCLSVMSVSSAKDG